MINATEGDIARDVVYVDHDRLWIYTYELAPQFCMTIFYGPGLGQDAPRPRSYASREEAVAGHEAALAEFGYRKTGLRKYRWFRSLEYLGQGMVNACRRPSSRKWGWIMTALWAFALFFPVSGIFVEDGFNLARWTGWINLVFGALDGYMLYQSIRGLMWTYKFPRAKRLTSPGRGSTGE